MNWYTIRATKKSGEGKFPNPVRARDEQHAISKRGLIPDNYTHIYVYELKETPTGESPKVEKLKDGE